MPRNLRSVSLKARSRAPIVEAAKAHEHAYPRRVICRINFLRRRDAATKPAGTLAADSTDSPAIPEDLPPFSAASSGAPREKFLCKHLRAILRHQAHPNEDFRRISVPFDGLSLG